MKKKITTLLMTVIISSIMVAQPPQAFKYQAVVRDGAGEIISSQAVDIKISIHDETPGGTIVYQETFSETTNQFGLISLNIGLGTPLLGPFGYINWSADSKFIEIEVDDGGGYVSLGTSELFSVPYALYSDRSADGFWGLNNSNIYYNNGNVGIGTDTPGNKLEIFGNNSEVGMRIRYSPTYTTVYGELTHALSGGFKINAHAGGGGWADMHFQTNGTTKMFLESAGFLGIGTTSPGTNLVVKSSGYTHGMNVLADDDDRIFRIRQMSGGGGGIYVFDESDISTILLNGEGDCWINSGRLGIGTTTPGAGLHLIGDQYPNSFLYIQSNTSQDAGIRLYEGTTAKWHIFNNSTIGGLHMYNTAGQTVFFANQSSGNVGIGTTSPASRLDVRGNVTIRDNTTGNVAVELGTGLDYAEGFNVSDKTNIKPGSILCIDPENPGNLKISSASYDSKVAGIVAGANSLGSGISLGTGIHDFNVALAGRVYCNVDASDESVEVGDLLTTSSLPGYAMKVVNRKKAQGAILGKAMESLEKGKKGQILVLVTLQ